MRSVPAYVRTKLTAPLFEMMGREKFEQLVNAHAMRRMGRPEEIARAVLFLLSNEASFLIGIAMPVDGGYLLKGQRQSFAPVREDISPVHLNRRLLSAYHIEEL